MENIELILAVTIPSLILFVITQLITKTVIEREKLRGEVALKKQRADYLYPLQLQAYERLIMLMERLTPNNLVIRSNQPGLELIQFHQKLLQEINHEYHHNISQQIYVSEKSWSALKNAIEILKTNINQSAQEVSANSLANSTTLATKVIENSFNGTNEAFKACLKQLRSELKKI